MRTAAVREDTNERLKEEGEGEEKIFDRSIEHREIDFVRRREHKGRLMTEF